MGRRRCRFRIGNAGEATYADAFHGYRACASYDGHRWFRVPTSFDGRSLVIHHIPDEDEVIYAYFAAYPGARRNALISRVEDAPGARVERLGSTALGRPIDLVIVGEEDPDKAQIWVTARQHPGETGAEWVAEGLIDRLLDEDDDEAQALLDDAVIHVIPCMNPDGGALGNQRTNAAGLDLNRCWDDPSPELAPEVFLVRRAMLRTGVDLFLDLHADERTTFSFAAGSEGVPRYSARLEELEHDFIEALLDESDDFRRERGYDLDLPGQADLSIAGNWVCEEHDCLSLTLETPFKDGPEQDDPERGWSPGRALRFGGALASAMRRVLPDLR